MLLSRGLSLAALAVFAAIANATEFLLVSLPELSRRWWSLGAVGRRWQGVVMDRIHWRRAFSTLATRYSPSEASADAMEFGAS
jgi:hypothetical protein